MFKKAVTATGIVMMAGLALGATSCDLEGTSEQDQSKPGSKQEEKKVSAQEVYDKVQNGMNREQVDTIAGGAPDNCIDSEDDFVGKSSTCTYGSVTVTFINGKVDSKTKL